MSYSVAELSEFFSAKFTLMSKSKENEMGEKPEQIICDTPTASKSSSLISTIQDTSATTNAEDENRNTVNSQTSILRYLRRG